MQSRADIVDITDIKLNLTGRQDMHEIIAEKTINCGIEKVWALVADFANLSWYTPAQKVEKIASENADEKSFYSLSDYDQAK